MPVYKDEARNTWYYSIYYKDVYGKGKRKVKRGFRTKKEAKLAESEMLQNIKPSNSKHLTFERVFYERLKHVDISARTRNNREIEYEKHMKREFGYIPITNITVAQCQDFRQRLVDNETIASGTKRNLLASFKSVFNYAEKFHDIHNPTRSIEAIKMGKTQKTYITRENFDKRVLEMDKLTNHKPILYRQFIQLLFYTGLRVGEALPLTWEDFDRDKKQLDINKTLVRGKVLEGVAKNITSMNTVPVPNHIAEMLESMDHDGKYIFGGDKPISYESVSVNFNKVFTEDGLTIHSLRHSFASYLVNKGVDMYVLMNIMRHSNIKQTIQTYSHMYDNTKRDVMKLFD